MSNSLYIDEIVVTAPRLPSGFQYYSGFGGTVFNMLPPSTDVGEPTYISFLDMVEGNVDKEEEWDVDGCKVKIKNTDDFTPAELLALRTSLMDRAKDSYLESAFEICADKGKTVEIYMDGDVHHGDGTTEAWGDFDARNGDAYGGFAKDTDGSDIYRISLNPYLINGDINQFKETLVHEILHIKWQEEWKHDRLKGAVPGAVDNVFGSSPLDPSRFDKGNSIMGTAASEQLNGANALNSIAGREGDDVIYGNILDDYLNGGVGDDVLWGGIGNDLLIPGVGRDDLHGGFGDDTYVFLEISTLNNIYDEGGTKDTLYLGNETTAYLYDYTDGSHNQLLIGMSTYTTTFIQNGQTTGRIESIILADGTVFNQSSVSNQASTNDADMLSALSAAGIFDVLAVAVSSDLFT